MPSMQEQDLHGDRISFIESLQKEKQIVLDTEALSESFSKEMYIDITMLPMVMTTSAGTNLQPPTLQPPKQKFLGSSFPSSSNSSPRIDLDLTLKKSEGESLESQCHDCILALKDLHMLQEIHLRKSQSCGARRSCVPSNEFDHWLAMLNELVDEHENKNNGRKPETETVKDHSPMSVKHHRTTTPDDVFRCNSLCLYLPGFGNKVKPNKAKKEKSQRETAVISRTVSMEKFECGSWASSAMPNYESEGESTNSYFDLPLELMRCNSINEVYSPINESFVFEKNIKGILKNGSSKLNARKSESSSRHVRFSPPSSSSSCPSSPSFCISPRLSKAREDFNAFLAAAQTA
ncbi:hypothetical protein TanjilG_15044 [Lupinus angustifolius]|uniref:Uncharacterized protein n=1 Tax=Lupinus angustifolius TaxID=3871 RepID=A0A1J7FVG3_LUPAN|nr:PREDICTED: uncharacterized protein LOC109334073 [Lupinus angustifolius]OIV92053.1 hypothetical protein TanjilG_15044 [Lupinus angustifolius]